ncbi:hypothetical protein [Pyruvatibacter mobilis]
MKDNLFMIGLVAAGVVAGLAGISLLRSNRIPLLSDLADLAHDGADG